MSDSLGSPHRPAGAGSYDLPPGLDEASFRRLGYRAINVIGEYLSGMRSRPVFLPMRPEEREALLDQPLSEHGMAPATILDEFCARVVTHPMGNGHPRFFGWVNSPPAPLGVLADALAAGIDPSCAGGDHAGVYLERCVVRWLMELVGFPTVGSMGLLVSGGSMASLTCLAAARHWAAAHDSWDVRAEGLQGNRPPLVLFLGAEGHSCLRKAAELLGLGGAAIRTIAVNDRFQMDLSALRAAVAEDRAAGKRPFCVAASGHGEYRCDRPARGARRFLRRARPLAPR